MTIHIGNFLRHSAERRPDAPAVEASGQKRTYGELNRAAAGCAKRLREYGVTVGDRVLFVLPNALPWIVIYQGVLQAGAIPVPLNARLTIPELSAIIADCQPRLVFASGDMAEALGSALPGGAVPVVDIDQDPVHEADSDPEPISVGQADDVAVILYSSGSTGQPKGVELTHLNIFWNAQAFAFDLLRLTPGDKGYTCLPFSHVFGHTCFFSAFLFTGASFLVDDKFDPGTTLRIIDRERISVFMGVPTMYWTLAKCDVPSGLDFSSWRACVSGGQALPEDVHERFERRFGVLISEGYGMTEASPSVVGCRFFGAPRKAGSAGEPYWGVKIRIVDDAGRDVPHGETGEILIAGPGVARGYFRQPDLTAAVFRDGWLHSGDIGRLDEDGFLFVVDRKKEIIISGGYNIYPREVEEVAHRIDGVLEVAAIGVPDERLGEKVVAFVVPATGTDVDSSALIDECARNLARYKVPREVRYLEELPRNATGKVDRGRLREIARTDNNNG
jgi:long-chain acyl-CoA synthetase